MTEESPPRRSLRAFSDLFITVPVKKPDVVPVVASEEVASSETSALAPPKDLLIGLVFVRPFPETLDFTLSFGRWLLSVFESATLVVTQPASASWARTADRFGLPNSIPENELHPIQSFALHEGMTLVLADRPLPEFFLGAAARRTTVDDSGPRSRVRIQAMLGGLDEKALRAMSWCDLLVAVIPAELEAFVDYYRFLKSAGDRREGCRFGVVLDRPGADFDLDGLERGWSAVAGRFLNAPGRFLGQLDCRRFADLSSPLNHRLGLCERRLTMRLGDGKLYATSREPGREALAQAFIRWVERWEQRATRGEEHPPGSLRPRSWAASGLERSR